MSEILPLLSEAVDELTKPHVHREQVSRYENGTWVHSRHRTDVPPLVQQLRAAVEPSSSSDAGKSSFSSRPSARLDAIDTLLRIEAASAVWLTRCGQALRSTLEDNLRALVGCAPGLDEQQQWDLTREARRWATWARVTTGWEVPPFRPNNTCPLCGKRGGLRVRAGDGVTSYETSAVCVECSEAWGPAEIGLLAEHIRAENGEEQEGAA